METPPEAVEMAVEPTGPPAPAPAPEVVRTSFVIPDLAAFATGLQSLSRPQRVKRLLFVADRSINVDQAKRAAELALFEATPGGGSTFPQASESLIRDGTECEFTL